MPTITSWTSDRWPNFTPAEFACRHCGEVHMDPAFLDVLQAIRSEYGKGMIVSSGYRCPAYNVIVSSTGRDGPHTTGRAADIAVDRGDALRLMRIALNHGVTGLGVQQKGGGRFLHLDILDGHARPTVWSY